MPVYAVHVHQNPHCRRLWSDRHHLPAFGLRAGDVQLAPGALKLWRLVYRMLIIERLPQQAHSAKTCLPISPGHTLKQERLIQIQQTKKYPPFTKRVMLRYRDFRQTLF